MIGKIMMGKSFRGCLQYCLLDKKEETVQTQTKNRAEIIGYNQCYGSLKELIQQFQEVRQLNPKLSKPVMHVTLSLAKRDYLTPDKLLTLAQRCAKDLGLEDNQWVAVKHKDTAHAHIHIVANRIGFDGKTVKDSNNYKKIAEFCRKAEFLYSLQKVQSPSIFLAKDKRPNQRLDSRKEKLKADIKTCLQQATSLEQFTEAIHAKGYQVIKSRGIAFRDQQKVYTKGSAVGYSLAKIEKILSTPIEQRTTQQQAKKQGVIIAQGNPNLHEFNRHGESTPNLQKDLGQVLFPNAPSQTQNEYDNSMGLFRRRPRRKKGKRM